MCGVCGALGTHIYLYGIAPNGIGSGIYLSLDAVCTPPHNYIQTIFIGLGLCQCERTLTLRDQFILTARNRSCAKVMFSQASVSHSVHGAWG